MRQARLTLWDTEAALCADFAETVRERGWTVYPETAGWDLLLVAPDSGVQIGVEAKLIGGLEVLAQAASRVALRWGDYDGRRGPDHVALLVGTARVGFVEVAEALGFNVFNGSQEARAREMSGRRRDRWRHCVPTPAYIVGWKARHWADHRESLPEIVPDVPAGVPAPVTLTAWRIGAIRLCRTLRERGYLMRSDFRAACVDMTRWRQLWLDPIGPALPARRNSLESMRFVARPGAVLPDEEHPDLTAQVVAHDAARAATGEAG